MHQQSARLALATLVGLVAALPATPVSALADDVEIRARQALLVSLSEELAEEFNADAKPSQRMVAQRQYDSVAMIETFAKGQYYLMLHLNNLQDWELAVMYQAGRDLSQNKPAEIRLTPLKVAVIVHPGNPLGRLSFDQLQTVLQQKGKDTKWPQLGGKGGKVVCYAEGKESIGRQIMQDMVMRFATKSGGGFYIYRDDLAQCSDAHDVIESVARDPEGLGFMLYSGAVPKTVKALALARTKDTPCVAPRAGAQQDYPLSAPLMLYVHPKAGATARQFAKWCVSAKGAKTVAEFLKETDGAPEPVKTPAAGTTKAPKEKK